MKAQLTATKPNGETVKIFIRCNDECKNGHDTFAITGKVYRPGTKVFSDRNMESCGCVHEDILKARPDLKIFVDLHLADGDGQPMYATENGFFHYMQGVGIYRTFTHSEREHKPEALQYLCNHLRISPDECEQLVRELNVIINPSRFNYAGDSIKALTDEIYNIEAAIKSLKKANYLDVDIIPLLKPI